MLQVRDGVLLRHDSTAILLHADEPIAKMASAGLLRLTAALVVSLHLVLVLEAHLLAHLLLPSNVVLLPHPVEHQRYLLALWKRRRRRGRRY